MKAPATTGGGSLLDPVQDPLRGSLSDSLQDNAGSGGSDTEAQVKPEEVKKPQMTTEEQRLTALAGPFAKVFDEFYQRCMPPVSVGPIRVAAGQFKSQLSQLIIDAKGTSAEVPAKQALGLADVVSSVKVVPAPKGLGKVIVAQNKAHASISRREEALFEHGSVGFSSKLLEHRLNRAVSKGDKHDARRDSVEDEYMKLIEQAVPEIAHFQPPISRLMTIFEPLSTKQMSFNVDKIRTGLLLAVRDPALMKFEQEGAYTREDLKENARGK